MTTGGVAILVTVIVGIFAIIGSIIKSGDWMSKRVTGAMDERINDRVEEHLKPILTLLQKLDGEPGDDERGIPARPGILQRQTATERQALSLAANAETLAERVGALQKVVNEIREQFDNNGGSTMRDAMDATRRAAERVAGSPLAA